MRSTACACRARRCHADLETDFRVPDRQPAAKVQLKVSVDLEEAKGLLREILRRADDVAPSDGEDSGQ